MAERIKGITVEIGGDTTGLNKALKGTNAEIKNTQNELKAVERALKLDPKNTDLLRQRQELLTRAIGQTSEKVDALKKAKERADKEMAEGTEVNQEEYRKLVREIATTQSSLNDLEKKARESNSVLVNVGEAAGKVAEGADKVAKATKGASAVAGGALAGIAGAAYKAVTASDDLNTLAKQSGFTTAEIQKMQYAADRIDVPMESITGAASKMRKQLSGSGESFAALGVEIRDSNGELRNSSDIFYDTIDALSKIENETERDVAAMAIFGKGADELAGIIDDGGAALRELGDEAERSGLIMSQETLDGLNVVNDEIDRLKAKSAATLATSGAKAMQALLPIFDKVVEKIDQLLNWIGSLDEGDMKLLTTILAIVAAISPVASIISKIAGTISTIMPIINTVITTVGALPLAIIALVTAIALFGDEIQRVLQQVDDFLQNVFAVDWSEQFGFFGDVLNGFLANFQNIWASIKMIFDGIIDFIRGVFTLDWERAWTGVQEIFGGIFGGLIELAKAPFNAIIGLMNGVVEGVNKMIRGLNRLHFDIPDWVPGIGGESFGLSLPEISKIPFLANGGILTSGSAIVGEAGPELVTVSGGRAVVEPLNRGVTVTMNNTFNGYDSAAGAAAARDLAAQINRALGRAY